MKTLTHNRLLPLCLVCLLSLCSTSLLQAQTQEIEPEPMDWRTRLHDVNNLSFGFEYTLIYQMASDVDDDSNSLLTGTYEFVLEWAPFENGVLTLGVEGGQIISHNDNESLRANVGSFNNINCDADSRQIVFSDFAYTHTFGDDDMIVTVGKIAAWDYYDFNKLANDETAYFIAGSLANNPAIAFRGNGLGVNVWANLSDNVYVSGGFFDNNAVSTETPFPTFAKGDFFYIGEIGYTVPGELSGTYRLTGWIAQTPDADGGGVAVSLDQHITDDLIVFGRWGIANESVNWVEQFYSAGIGLEAPFGREEDLVAIGWACSDPSDPALDNESLIEAFYRYEFNDHLEISPIVQAIIDPSNSPESGTVFTAALRFQFVW